MLHSEIEAAFFFFFFFTEFDSFRKSGNGAQYMSSRLSDVAPTAALGSILRFKLKRQGLCCYGYSVFTLTAPTKLCNNGSIVAVKSLSCFSKRQKPLARPSLALVAFQTHLTGKVFAFVSRCCRPSPSSMYVPLCNLSQLLSDISFFSTFLFIQSMD